MTARANNKKHTPKFRHSATLWAFVLILATAAFVATPWGQQSEARFGLNWLYQTRGAVAPPDKVIVLAITPDTADQLGFPEGLSQWPRSVHARLLTHLTEAGATAVVMDLFFRQPGDPDEDRVFSRALSTAGNVVLFAQRERQYLPPPHSGTLDRLIRPMPDFARSARATAPFFLTRFPDQVVYFPLRLSAAQAEVTLPVAALRLTHPALAKTLEARPSDHAWFNLYGPPRTLTTLDYAEVLRNPGAYELKGAAIFVGFSARYQAGQRDEFRTVFTQAGGLDISGVELLATAYANLRDGFILTPAGPMSNAAWVLAWGGLLLGLTWRWPKWLLLSGLITSLALFGISYTLFSRLQFWLPLSTLLLGLFPLLLLLAYRRHWLATRESQAQLHTAFSHYLPEEEIQAIRKADGRLPEGTVQPAICLVTDARGYTRLSEQLALEELGELMRHYYAALIDPLKQHGAVISDVTGDGLIALWPMKSAESTSQVLQGLAALDQSLEQFRERFPKYPLPTGMALHEGEAMLGHFGAADAYEYRALGDLVNTTARLEGVGKQLGLDRVYSAEALVATSERPESWRYLGDFLLVGKQTPVELYTAPGGIPELDQSIQNLREHSLSGETTAALLSQLQSLRTRYPSDGPLRFLEAHLRQAPSEAAGNNGKAKGCFPIHLIHK